MVIKGRKFKKRQNLAGLIYRVGPSSIEDERALSGHITKEDDGPQGLNELIPHAPEKVANITELAGSEVLIVYFAKLGTASRDSVVDLDYLETLINSGAKVNYTDRHGQTVMHEVRTCNIKSEAGFKLMCYIALYTVNSRYLELSRDQQICSRHREFDLFCVT